MVQLGSAHSDAGEASVDRQTAKTAHSDAGEASVDRQTAKTGRSEEGLPHPRPVYR